MTNEKKSFYAKDESYKNDFLDKLATGWNILLLFMFFMLVTTLFFPWFSDVLGVPEEGVETIDLQFTYSPQELYRMLENYGEQGRRVYAISHLSSDVIFPVIYAFLFSLSITYTFRRAFSLSSPLQKFKYLPFLLLGFDLLENILLVILLLAFPQPLTALALMAGLVTAIKWILSGLVVLLPFVGLFAWLIKSLRRLA